MRARSSLLVVACLLFLCALPSFAGGVDMQPGQWEVTAKMEMANMPFAMPAMSYTICLTEEDLVPKSGDSQADDCKVVSQSINGNTVSWEIVCNTESGKTTSSGSITYSGDSFAGTVNMTIPGSAPIQQSMSGRRIGNCN